MDISRTGIVHFLTIYFRGQNLSSGDWLITYFWGPGQGEMRNQEHKTQIANQQGTEKSNCQGTENLMENSPQGKGNAKTKLPNQQGTDNKMV